MAQLSIKEKYRCVVIDDEPIAIKIIDNYIKRIESLAVVGCYTNAMHAHKELHSGSVDLLFLDIEMPGINGLDFLKALRKPPHVIFTTAYRNYAADAFEVCALDYLVKPIPFERFLMAINRFLEIKSKPDSKEANTQSNQFIVLKSEKKHHRVRVADILYVESLDDYILVYTKDLKLVCYLRLAALEEELKLSPSIVRVHRSFIVNTQHAKAYTACSIDIAGKHIPIGRSYRQQVALILAI